jgi:hypothetical protein
MIERMQTISIPYQCSEEDQAFIALVQRKYSAAVRAAFKQCLDEDGKLIKEKDLRELVKHRHAGGIVDAWSLHCATLEARDLHKSGQPQHMVFGGRDNLERRRKGLISKDEWRTLRLRPFASRGDKSFGGNRHFKLDLDGRTCKFSMMLPKVEGQKMQWRTIMLHLPLITGNAGCILRQAAELAADKKINVMFRIDQQKLHVTIDPVDLPAHPERRRPVKAVAHRAIGIDLNPESIGVSVVENKGEADSLADTTLLDHLIIKTVAPGSTSSETVREMLAAVCDHTVRLARKWGVGVIAFEQGLGKLRSAGRSRDTNRKNNYWTRTVLIQMMTRKARLAGIEVIQVWGGYSTTIGNIAFDAPDAAASGAEIARRALARRAGLKDVLPVLDEGWLASRRKDLLLPAEAKSWKDVHQAIKAAKIGYRRPHPEVLPPDPDGRVRRTASTGHAVLRLGHRRRPGVLFQPGLTKAQGDSPETCVTKVKVVPTALHSTRKSG